MRILLLYPKYPTSFWSFEKSLAVAGRALLPPLGLITVAAILPQDWDYKLVDRNVREVTEAEWDWADLVIISAMVIQKPDTLAQIQAAKARQKKVAVGGPYPTSMPEDVQIAGADYLVLDEGEITLPLFVEALERGDPAGIFRATEKPDVTTSPVPRYDLLQLDTYFQMAVQFSRGCPFQCEFCDIIVLYGRKPRTKTPSQLLKELDCLYELGWRNPVFMVDDNFIGNKRNVKLLLEELKVWQADHNYPFIFTTEASVDLAQDQKLMDLMIDCNFYGVFLGIESPDAESLKVTKKFQNLRNSLNEAVDKIARTGLQVMAGFIMGFDGEKQGADDRIIEFVEQTAIPIASLSLLTCPPDTALWHRLSQEGRLIDEEFNGNNTTLMNFLPTRPLEEIVQEYLKTWNQIYDPQKFLARTYRYCMKMQANPNPLPRPAKNSEILPAILFYLKLLGVLFWRQGIVRKTRWHFWWYFLNICRRNPGILLLFVMTCSHFEHLHVFNQVNGENVSRQLATYLAKYGPNIMTEKSTLPDVAKAA
jgi:radical SAM superfamily enzyme YgiQ (UPF0313 family)